MESDNEEDNFQQIKSKSQLSSRITRSRLARKHHSNSQQSVIWKKNTSEKDILSPLTFPVKRKIRSFEKESEIGHSVNCKDNDAEDAGNDSVKKNYLKTVIAANVNNEEDKISVKDSCITLANDCEKLLSTDAPSLKDTCNGTADSNCKTNSLKLELKSEYIKEEVCDKVINDKDLCDQIKIESLNRDGDNSVTTENSYNQLENVCNKENQMRSLSCPLCWKTFEKGQLRTAHMKSCATRHNINTHQLLDAIELQDRQAAERKAMGLPHVIPAQLTKKPAPRKTGGDSNDGNLQLALALSVSMHEAAEHEQFKQDACLLEAGLGHEVVERQKTMLERFGFTSSRPAVLAPVNARGRHTNKNKNTKSILTSRTQEERERLVTEKVAIILMGDESKASEELETSKEPYIPSESLSYNLQRYQSETSLLWNKVSCIEKERENFYVSDLSEFITPTKVQPGDKLKHLSQVRGRSRTPEAVILPTYLDQNSNQFSEVKRNKEEIESIRTPKIHESLSNSSANKPYNPTFLVETLSKDWKNMLNKKVMSDVTIYVENNVEIPAHKLVFHVRCRAILHDIVSEIKENKKKSEILLWVDISQRAALAFLQFIYCGITTKINRLYEEDTQNVYSLAKRYRTQELLQYFQDVCKSKTKINSISSKSPHIGLKYLEEETFQETVISSPMSLDSYTPQKELYNKKFFSTTPDLQNSSTNALNIDKNETAPLVCERGKKKSHLSTEIVGSTSPDLFEQSVVISQNLSQDSRNCMDILLRMAENSSLSQNGIENKVISQKISPKSEKKYATNILNCDTVSLSNMITPVKKTNIIEIDSSPLSCSNSSVKLYNEKCNSDDNSTTKIKVRRNLLNNGASFSDFKGYNNHINEETILQKTPEKFSLHEKDSESSFHILPIKYVKTGTPECHNNSDSPSFEEIATPIKEVNDQFNLSHKSSNETSDKKSHSTDSKFSNKNISYIEQPLDVKSDAETVSVGSFDGLICNQKLSFDRIDFLENLLSDSSDKNSPQKARKNLFEDFKRKHLEGDSSNDYSLQIKKICKEKNYSKSLNTELEEEQKTMNGSMNETFSIDNINEMQAKDEDSRMLSTVNEKSAFRRESDSKEKIDEERNNTISPWRKEENNIDLSLVEEDEEEEEENEIQSNFSASYQALPIKNTYKENYNTLTNELLSNKSEMLINKHKSINDENDDIFDLTQNNSDIEPENLSVADTSSFNAEYNFNSEKSEGLKENSKTSIERTMHTKEESTSFSSNSQVKKSPDWLKKRDSEEESKKKVHNSNHHEKDWDSFDEMCNTSVPLIFSHCLSQLLSNNSTSSQKTTKIDFRLESSSKSRKEISCDGVNSEILKYNKKTPNVKDKQNDVIHEDSLLAGLNNSVFWRDENAPKIDKSPIKTPHKHFSNYKTPIQHLNSLKYSNNVTPPANYSAMKTPQLKKELKKYGLKPSLTKKQAKKMLRYIYDQLHPFITVSDSDDDHKSEGKSSTIFNEPNADINIPRSPNKKSKIPDKSLSSSKENKEAASVGRSFSARKKKLTSTSQNDGGSDSDFSLSQESSSSSTLDVAEEMFYDDLELFSQSDGPLSSQDVTSADIDTVVRNFITNNSELYHKVLLYEPIWLEKLHSDLKTNNYKFKLNQLMDYLDEQCITFRSAQGQRNRQRKRQKKNAGKEVKRKKTVGAKRSMSSASAANSSLSDN